MGTRVLVDLSLSVYLPASGEDGGGGVSVEDVIRPGLLHFLAQLERVKEAVGVSPFVREVSGHGALSRKYASLRSQVYQMQVGEGSATLVEAVESAVAHAKKKKSKHTVTQLVVWTDRALQPNSTARMLQLSALCNEARIALHVFMLGDARKLQLVGHRRGGPSVVERLCLRCGGSFFHLRLPLTSAALRSAIDELVERHYHSYRGVLRVSDGATEQVELEPNPHGIVLPSLALGPAGGVDSLVANDYGAYRSAHSPRVDLPPDLQVVGFLPVRLIVRAPIASRHVVKVLEGRQSPLMITMLLSLDTHEMAALVTLTPDDSPVEWYAYLQALKNSGNVPELVLCVFEPGYEVPWLGPFSGLRTAAEEQGAGERVPLERSVQPSFRVRDGEILSLEPQRLAKIVARIEKNLSKLPRKQASLEKDCRAVAATARIYAMPELAQQARQVLSKALEEKRVEGAEMVALVGRLRDEM